MAEILTESFCERCGTRYTFEPVANRRKPLSAIGTLGRGIRHFVSDPGSSLDEAIAVARSESEQRSTASALEAFHRTFNFCLSCRQYTCADCWNVVEGRCLSCAPTPDATPPVTRVDTAVPSPLMDIAVTPVPMHVHETSEPAGADRAVVAEAAVDDAAALADAQAAEAQAAEAVAARDAAAALAAADAREAAEAAVAAAEAAQEAAAQAEARRAAEVEAEAVAAALAEAEASALEAMALAEAQAVADAAERDEVEAASHAAAMAAVPQDDPTLAFEPGLNLDDQIAAYERQLATSEARLEPEPDPEQVVVEPVTEPAAASIEPIPTAIGQPIPASSIDGELHWPDIQVAAAAAAPAWQSATDQEQAPATRGAGLPSADAPVLPLAARACPSCGLSLSANARFCRRCGTPQQVDAPS